MTGKGQKTGNLKEKLRKAGTAAADLCLKVAISGTDTKRCTPARLSNIGLPGDSLRAVSRRCEADLCSSQRSGTSRTELPPFRPNSHSYHTSKIQNITHFVSQKLPPSRRAGNTFTICSDIVSCCKALKILRRSPFLISAGPWSVSVWPVASWRCREQEQIAFLCP